MSDDFKWVPDLARGEWLRPLEAESLGSILSIVPRGFEMYARVFHPVERDRPRETKTWQGLDEATYFNGIPDIKASLETERATWASAAASFGTIMHAEAQYARLVRREHGNVDGMISPDGWRYGNTSEGNLDAVALAMTSAVLADHTATPHAGIAAVWDGWGGLVSSAGLARLVFGSSDGMPRRYTDADAAADNVGLPLRKRLGMAVQRRIAGWRLGTRAFPGVARDNAELGTGLLPGEVAAGPRFELHGGTGRSYILFEAGANDFANTAWPVRAPWVDNPTWAQSPSILWPDDRSWMLATEIDFDSTLIAGTAALIHDLMHTPGLEVLPIRTDADLSSEGDLLNRLA